MHECAFVSMAVLISEPQRPSSSIPKHGFNTFQIFQGRNRHFQRCTCKIGAAYAKNVHGTSNRCHRQDVSSANADLLGSTSGVYTITLSPFLFLAQNSSLTAAQAMRGASSSTKPVHLRKTTRLGHPNPHALVTRKFPGHRRR